MHKYSEKALQFFYNKNYLTENESLDNRIDEMVSVVRNYEKDYSEGLADRLSNLIRNKILIPSSPQWANLGRTTEGSTPLPASCYILGVENKIQGIFYSFGETAVMSKLGGGIGQTYINVFDKNTKLGEDFFSNSKLDWIRSGLRASQNVSQSNLRRGYSTPSILITDVEYYDFLEKLDKKNPDKNDPLAKNTGCVVLPSGFWEDLKTSEDLQDRFLAIMEKRMAKGKIYILDVDNCNKNQSPVYEKLGLKVDATNICTEALTVSSLSEYSFVCMLASLNLSKWDIIKKDPQIIKDAFMFLDINISEYIRLTEGVQFLEKARKSAIDKRDIGLGTLGFADLLQSKGFAFGDMYSRALNKEIYKTIRKAGEEYTLEIGEKLGSPKLCKDAGMVRRNVSLMMVAPNKTTGSLADTSEGIAPRMTNYMNEELAGINNIFKNNHLEKILDFAGKNNFKTWESIRKKGGSVQHLDFLSSQEKDVFKTASEISPKDLIDLAADRQEFIDMAQSINLFGRPQYTMQDVYNIHKYAFSKGIKTLYYYYPQGHAAIESNDGSSWDDCVSCAD